MLSVCRSGGEGDDDDLHSVVIGSYATVLYER